MKPAELTFERPQPGEDLIRFEHVFKAFGPKKVMEDLSLTIRAGETLTLIGPSGAGKSVTLKCLIGLLEPDQGHIYFQGRDVTAMNERQLLEVRRRVSMVFQGAALFDSLTVGENIAYPLHEHFPKMAGAEVKERVAQKLALVNLPGIEEMKPADLSGGMRKRVGLARAIATDPEVILWDEPTTGLDPLSVRIIDELINSMKEKLGCTSIVVTHDMESAFEVSDRIGMLWKGKIVQVGTVSEMKASRIQEVRDFFEARTGPKARAQQVSAR